MSEYRDKLVEDTEATSAAIMMGVTQIDVTPTGNYAATWMKQQKVVREWDEIDATADLQGRFSDSSEYDYSGLDIEVEGTGESAVPYGHFWNRETQQLERQRVEAVDGPESLSFGFMDNDGEFQGAEIPRDDPAYDAIRNSEQFQTAQSASMESYQAWSENNALPDIPDAPAIPVSPSPSPLAQAQKGHVSRPIKLDGVPQEDQPKQDALDPLTKTQQEAKNRGDALRARQARSHKESQDNIQKLMELGEENAKRQPNFRAGATTFNATVDDFGVAVADQMENMVNTLGFQAERIRRLEQKIAEASQ